MKETSRPPSSSVVPAASSPSQCQATVQEQSVVLPVQCKLTVGAIDDPLEAEADAVANKVVAIPQNSYIQRKCSHCEEEERAQRKPLAAFIQKKEASSGSTVVPESVSDQIASSRGSGSVLDSGTKSFMESRFSNDFSNVRIHTDNEAASLSTQLNAQAFTIGNDIYFNNGKFAPASSAGKRLLAHELTHVVQQSNTVQRRYIQRVPFARRDPIHDFILDDFSRETGLPRDQVTQHSAAYAEWLRNRPVRLGSSAGGRGIYAYEFPGTTTNRALVIGGVHGSELSGIEVVEQLITQLRTGPRPYYTVTIVPRLFPDNAHVREGNRAAIQADSNVGRYTRSTAVDPNRQMPEFGRSFDPSNPVDSRGRTIEAENVMLLELIDRIRPSRVVSVHAMHSDASAGIFADPRTDQNQIALGYDTDRALALEMARLAQSRGAAVSGNRLGSQNENTTYALDPPIAQAGQRQTRSRGQASADHRGEGVSLGGWGSTAVCDAAHPERNRSAMRIITIEMPRGQRSQDMQTQAQRDARRVVVQAHVDAIREIFLGPHQVETNTPPRCP
jgi:hypothetical protein